MPAIFDLVLRGGGIKGIAFIGAFEKLNSPRYRVRRMIGTSAGAIFATCYAAGYSPAEMLKEIEKRDEHDNLIFAGFTARSLIGGSDNGADVDWLNLARAALDRDIKKIRDLLLPSLPIRDVTDFLIQRIPDSVVGNDQKSQAKSVTGKAFSLLLLGGASDDRPFLKWMKDRLAAKDGDPDITLGDFHKRFSEPRGQQLSLVATDLQDQEVLVLNHRTAPDLPVVQAVRMSMSIPYVWRDVVWKASWKKYLNRDKTGHPIVDGGVLANFPIRYFLEARHSEKENSVLGPPPLIDGKQAPAQLLGLLLDPTRPVTVLEKQSPDWVNWLPVVQTTEMLLDTMTDTWDLEVIREFFDAEGKARKETDVTPKGSRALCRIGTRGYSALEFNLDKARLDELVDRGRCGMDEFLKER